MIFTNSANLRHLCKRAIGFSINAKLMYQVRTFKKTQSPTINQQIAQNNHTNQTKQQVLKTYLQIIPPYRLQNILHPQKTDVTQFTSKMNLNQQQLQKLYKKIKKSVHMIPIQTLTQVLQVISTNNDQSQHSKMLSRKIYTKIMNIAYKKLNLLSLEQIIDFMYKLVKLNHKQFEFMKQVQRVIIEQKIKINYPLIRKILWSFTHLDVGSAVLYSHISKTLKIGQHQFSPIELAEAAYMLSKSSQNASGGFGVFQIAQKSLLLHLPRLQFHDLVKASSYMLAQNIGSNQFQTELQAELYRKYPDRPNLRINDLVSLLKSTSTYFFKYKEKALLNMLQASTNKLAPQANLEQFQDIVWSWGRAGKGDRGMWGILQAQINNKFINLLKPRQLAFFYFSLCCTEYSSAETIINLEKKFMEMVASNPDINQHYLLKFLLGMQKRKDYSQKSFATVSKLITDRLSKLSPKELVAFAKIINESDLCYENKQSFKDMQQSLMRVCRTAIAQRIYMFKLSEIVEIAYMWIKLDVGQSQSNPSSNKFVESLLNYLNKSLHQIPKSTFLKALFCFTIKDKYKESFQLIAILQELTKYGPITYFFSPYQLPLAAYCVFHLIVNSEKSIPIKLEMVNQLAWAMEKTNPAILNKFVRNGYEECMRLKKKYYSMYPEEKQANHPNHRTKSRNKST